MADPLFNWLKERSAGVLLHPTALPGSQGIGTLDANAVAFLQFLSLAGFKSWQICPLGPTGYGDSPYQCFSAFAGNPYLIDLAALVRAGLLTADDLRQIGSLRKFSEASAAMASLLQRTHMAAVIRTASSSPSCCCR